MTLSPVEITCEDLEIGLEETWHLAPWWILHASQKAETQGILSPLGVLPWGSEESPKRYIICIYVYMDVYIYIVVYIYIYIHIYIVYCIISPKGRYSVYTWRPGA